MSGPQSAGTSSSRVTLTSDEVNVLIYRYLLDSGFRHAAYVFQSESQLHRSPMVSVELAPGALVTYLQKGLLYLYLETHVTDEGVPLNCADHFSLLRPHDHVFINTPTVPPAKPVPDYDKILQRTASRMDVDPPSRQPSQPVQPAVQAAQPAVQTNPPAPPQQILAAIAAASLPVPATGKMGNFVAALTRDGRVTVCDLTSGAVQFMIPQMQEISESPHPLGLMAITASQEGCLLATHAKRGVAVWDIGNPRTLEIYGAQISGILPRWAPGSRRFSLLTEIQTLNIFVHTGKHFDKFPITFPTEVGRVLDVLWLTSNVFVVGLDSAKFLVCRISQDQHEISRVAEIPVSHKVAFKFAFRRGRLAVAGNLGLDFFDVEIGEEISVRHLVSVTGDHEELVTELAWSAGSDETSQSLATACDGNVVNVWTRDGTRLATWSEISTISALTWVDSETNFVVIGMESGKVRVYEGRTGRFCEEIKNAEEAQVEDLSAVVDEATGTAFITILGLNSKSLRVASRKVNDWLRRASSMTDQPDTSTPAESSNSTDQVSKPQD